MVKGLAKHRQVVSCCGLDPRSDASVEPSTRRRWKGFGSRLADEVVGDPRRSTDTDRQTASHEFASRVPNPVDLPAQQPGGLLVGEWSRADGKGPQERARVRAQIAQPLNDEAGRICHGAAAGECLHPERRAAGPTPEVGRAGIIEVPIDRLGERPRILEGKRAEIDERPPIGGQIRLDAPAKRRRSRGWPSDRDHRCSLTCRCGRAEQVVDERERSLIHPLEVVDRDQDRPFGRQGPLGGLEDAERVPIL